MDNSGVNTIILVLIAALVVFGIVWYFKPGQSQDQERVNVELSIPADSNENTR